MESRIKNVIWSSDNVYSLFRDNEFYEDFMIANEIDEMSDNERWDLAYEMNNEYLEDERCNLNIDVHSPIIAIADLGLWNGRRTGYKMIRSTNIKDCLSTDCDYAEWYCDAHNFRATMTHHDGTNNILYRMRKEGITEMQWDGFLYKIYTGKVKRSDITRYTKSLLPFIAEVYGWKYRTYPKTNYWDKQKFTGVGETKHKNAA